MLIIGLLIATLGPTPSAQAVVNPGSIAGTVTGLDGFPLPGVTVSVLSLTYPLHVVGQDETDATGAYQVDNIAANTPGYPVRFTDPTAEYATEWYDDSVQVGDWWSTDVPVTANAVTTGVDASLEPAASITGRLTTVTGAPVTSGEVTLFYRPGGVTTQMGTYATDQTGHYSITGVKAAKYALGFYDPVSGNHEFWNDQPSNCTDQMSCITVASQAHLLDVANGDTLVLDAVLGGFVQNTASPTIAGAAQVGQPLTASKGTWTPTGTVMTYRWVVGADTVPSDDPTGPVYVPTPADVGKTIRVHVTGTFPGWVDGSATSAPTGPVAAAPVTTPPPAPSAVSVVVRPRVKGTLEVGHVVRVSHGVWKPSQVVLKYQWYAGGKAITGATHRRLTLFPKYEWKRLTVRVKAKAAGYDRAIVWTKPTARIQP